MRASRLPSRLCLALLCLLSFAGASNAQKKVTAGAHELAFGQPAPWVERLPLPDTPQARPNAAPLAMLLADTQFRAQPGAPEQYVRRILHSPEAAALDSMSQIQIAYNPAYQKVTLHGIRIHRGGVTLDRTESASVRLIEREEQMNARVYSGVVSVAVLVAGLQPGDMLEYEYTVHGQNPVFRDRYVQSAAWLIDLPVEYRRVRLLAPPARRITYKVHGAEAQPKENVRDGWRETIWEGRSLRGVRPEDRTPRWHNPFGWIQFTEFAGWRDVADWAVELYPERPLSAELADLIKKFRGAGPTDEQRALAALRFVQEDIRYFAVAFGESSHRPNNPEETVRRRLGDCKDKTLLLITLLRGLGIEAKPVLVSVSTGKSVAAELPSPLAFDHVIAVATIGGTTFWLDATITGQRGPLLARAQHEYLGQGLIVERGRNALTAIDRPRGAVEAFSHVHEKFELNSFDRAARLTVTSIYRGNRAEAVRDAVARSRRDDLDRFFINDLARRYPKVKAAKPWELKDDEQENRVTVVEHYEVPGFMELVQERWVGRLVAMALEPALRLPETLQRQSPLFVEHPVEHKYSFEMQLPPSVSMMQDPVSRKISNAAFELTGTHRFRGNAGSGEYVYRSRADVVSPTEMPKFTTDVKAGREWLFNVVSVPRRAETKAAATKTSTSLATRLRQRQTELQQRVTQVIDSGRLSGEDLAEAHFRRGLARSSLENYDNAIADLDKTLSLNPTHPGAHVELAMMQIARGEYEKALATLNQALTVGTEPDEVYAKRGQTLFYMGRFADAAEQFRRAVADTRDAERVPFYLLWHGWSAARARAPLSPEMDDRIRNEAARSEWPRPALRLVLGTATPEEVLRSAQASGNADETQMNLCEAYYNIGQYYLVRGERDKAREAFEKASGTGIILYLEYVYAKKELAQLAR